MISSPFIDTVAPVLLVAGSNPLKSFVIIHSLLIFIFLAWFMNAKSIGLLSDSSDAR